MNRNDRLTIDRNIGDLFCEIERAQKLLSFILEQQFSGKDGAEMMETLLEFVNDRLHFVLVRYNMIMGHKDRIGEEYYISMVRDMELAAKHEELQEKLLDVWSGNGYTKETREKAMKRYVFIKVYLSLTTGLHIFHSSQYSISFSLASFMIAPYLPDEEIITF